MGGFFGVASHNDCVFDLFYGTDYHSHLGTRRAGLAVYDKEEGFNRSIHNIESTNFRPKFDKDILKMKGCLGIGCISDFEPQPLIVRSHHGTYAITTVGKINNIEKISNDLFSKGHSHFLEMSGGDINPTELVATLINQEETIVDGIRYAQDVIDGSMTLMLLTKDGIYAARDKYGRTPVEIGYKEGEDGGHCICFESFSFLNLGYSLKKELGPGEVVFVDADSITQLVKARQEMRVCSFLWIYYGFPASTYEGLNVEDVRYRCGYKLAQRDMERNIEPNMVAGVPDSGIAHAVGYANKSGVPYSRPFVKYTPTWPRSFMPTIQSRRDLIARMKLIPIRELLEDKKLLLIDDSIVRGTQLRETTQYLYKSGVKEVHIRPACPPLVFGCRYLNFSRSNSEAELITRRMIEKLEGSMFPSEETLAKYTDPNSEEYMQMLEEIRKQLGFTSLHYHRLDDMIEAIGMDKCKLCTYCWDGRE
ncbi:amidophosphoribosyltransferase [Acetitomaculum ruminis DSM 5522]|uniref:Amidophosphoribosyltransferase n=1 Tax=Acetitomaculum ruminis DSM 5522 TaxID=1120918 RepID=A0A1I1A0L9_9FIRM|nr:amidophosphoribosyltransferase [Acetitomaculum ruminis]SFB30108.1 amidophosphoribosyltransferase [Acetitomaculum ruminis DSM 5522]